LSLDLDRDALAARDLLAAAAREAGAAALAWFRPGKRTSAAVHTKAGGSPVTEADLAADAFLRRRLGEAFPDAGWLSEETADDGARLERRAVVIVDPIDGTRAFVDGDPRWTVCAALVVDGRPLAGVVHAPALGETYLAARGAGASKNGAPVAAAAGQRERHRAAGPKHLLAAMAARLGAPVDVAPFVPSLAYRLCLAAEGALDFAVAGSNSHDWDVAAADLVLAEAGAKLVAAEGEALRYNRPRVVHPALLARPDALAPHLLDAFRAAAGG
jgi:myo-inositol-1(or 4)-monophosphatase